MIKIKVFDNETDEISVDETVIAFDKNNNIYPIYKTSKSYIINSCLGRVRYIMSNDFKIIKQIMPLSTSCEPYTMVEIELLKKHYDLYLKLIG
jgi:hypothetical protein